MQNQRSHASILSIIHTDNTFTFELHLYDAIYIYDGISSAEYGSDYDAAHGSLPSPITLLASHAHHTRGNDDGFQHQFARADRLFNELITQRKTVTDAPDPASTPDLLYRLGRLIYEQLFPSVIQDGLKRLPQASPLIIVTNTGEIPWELAHDDVDFLVTRFAVSRRLPMNRIPPVSGRTSTQKPPAQNWSALLIGNPTGDLLATSEEIEQIANLLATVPGIAPPRILMRHRASRQSVLQELASGSYGLIHYSGHVHFDPNEPEASGLQLARGETLTVGEIERALAGAPFVFLNGCESARAHRVEPGIELNIELNVEPDDSLPYLGQGAYGLTDAFILGGAQGCLGSFWPVHDNSSRRMALAFYRNLLQGEPFGEALRQARLIVRDRVPWDPIWASYTLYVDPQRDLGLPRLHQRRPGTVLALALPNISQLYERLHEEEATRKIDNFVSELTTRIQRYGGLVRVTAPGMLFGLFGLPITRHNDAERAILAAFDVARLYDVDHLHKDAPESLLTPSIGISSGTLFLPSEAGREYATAAQHILGRALHESVELARHAQMGEILATASVHTLVNQQFRFEEMPTTEGLAPHFRIPSSHLPIQHLPTVQSGRIIGRYGVLYGREHERETLRDIWAHCKQGQGNLVGITGEAGIGKSHLIGAFQQELQTEPHHWYVLTSPSAYSPGPFEVVTQLFRSLLPFPQPENTEPTTATTSEDAIARALWQQLAASLSTAMLSTMGMATDARAGTEAITESVPEEMTEDVALLGELFGLPHSEFVPLPALTYLDAQARRRRLSNLLGGLLAQACQETPAVLALEDAHWMDEASLEVLHQLLIRADRLPILVLATFRSEAEWQPPWWNRRNYRQLHLDVLEERAVERLLASLLPSEQGLSSESLASSIRLDFAEHIMRHSNGNPLFVRELVRALQESGALQQIDNQWAFTRPLRPEEMPGTVQRLVLARIESLPRSTRQVLSVAAVVGDSFAPQLVQTVLLESTARGEVEASLSELEGRDFIFRPWGQGSDMTYQFNHALVREVAYARLSGERRRRYHHRIGDVMAETTNLPVEQLAHHYYQSVIIPREKESVEIVRHVAPSLLEKAVHHLVRAGQRARSTYAARAALRYYEQALQVAHAIDNNTRNATPYLLDIYEGMGAAYQTLTELESAIDSWESARHLLGENPDEPESRHRGAELTRRIGQTYEWKSDYPRALVWLERGLAELGFGSGESVPTTARDPDRTLAASLHIRIGSVHYNQGNLDAAAQACEAALTMIGALESHAVQAEAYNLLGIVSDLQGDTETALAHYNRSLAIWSELHDDYQVARVEDNIGVTYLYAGKWQDAYTHMERGYRFWTRLEDQYNMAFACLNLGLIDLYRGDWDVAQARFEQAFAVWEKAQNRRWTALCHTNLGLLEIERESWEVAQGHFAQSQSILEELDIRDLLPEVYYGLAEVALGQTHMTDALELAEKAITLAREQSMRPEEANAQRTVGKTYLATGDLTRAETYLMQSLTIHMELSNRYEAARTRLDLARLYQAQGNIARATGALMNARIQFETLGAKADLQKASLLLTEIEG